MLKACPAFSAGTFGWREHFLKPLVKFILAEEYGTQRTPDECAVRTRLIRVIWMDVVEAKSRKWRGPHVEVPLLGIQLEPLSSLWIAHIGGKSSF